MKILISNRSHLWKRSSKGEEQRRLRMVGERWYIPHHGFHRAKKPNKLCVVSDSSVRCNRTSLNDQLLSGPDMFNSFSKVLIRFRQHLVALMCNVEKMIEITFGFCGGGKEIWTQSQVSSVWRYICLALRGLLDVLILGWSIEISRMPTFTLKGLNLSWGTFT